MLRRDGPFLVVPARLQVWSPGTPQKLVSRGLAMNFDLVVGSVVFQDQTVDDDDEEK